MASDNFCFNSIENKLLRIWDELDELKQLYGEKCQELELEQRRNKVMQAGFQCSDAGKAICQDTCPHVQSVVPSSVLLGTSRLPGPTVQSMVPSGDYVCNHDKPPQTAEE